MFGYVKPNFDALGDEQKKLYRSAYCGLCEALKGEYGRLSTLFLSNDMVFFALLLHGDTRFEDRRCAVNPFRRVNAMCADSFGYAAACHILLTDAKLADDRQDEPFFRRTFSALLRRLFRKRTEKARLLYPDAARIIDDMLHKQSLVEARQDCGVDAAAHPFCEMLSALCGLPAPDRIRERLGYMTGRFVYLADALCDLGEDKRRGRFNPFASREYSDAKQYAMELINESCFEMSAAARLLEKSPQNALIEEIINGVIPNLNAKIEREEKYGQGSLFRTRRIAKRDR